MQSLKIFLSKLASLSRPQPDVQMHVAGTVQLMALLELHALGSQEAHEQLLPSTFLVFCNQLAEHAKQSIAT